MPHPYEVQLVQDLNDDDPDDCEALSLFHNIQKRQSQTEYHVTIDTSSLLNLASGLKNILNTVQKATNAGQVQFGIDPQISRGQGENYSGDLPRGFGQPNGPPGRGPPPVGPPGRPRPPGNSEFEPPGLPKQHFGPPSHEGPPRRLGPPEWSNFGPPGPPRWQGVEPPGYHGPPDNENPSPSPPPFEGGVQHGHHHHHHHNRRPPHRNNNYNNNQNKGSSEEINQGNSRQNDKSNIVGYLDGGFPVILLEDNEIRR